jgi:WD40 repeat protein
VQLIKSDIIIVVTAIIILFFSCTDFRAKDTQYVASPEETEGIHAAFYNSNGSKIALSTTKGRIILTDSTLTVIKINQIHKGRANSSFFSLDDKYIISGGQDKLLNVTDANTLEIVHQYDFKFNSWTSVHGYTTLAGCGEDGKLVVYNKYSNDTLIRVIESQGAFHLYYISPDTSLAVCSGYSGYEFDILNNQIRFQYKGHKDLVYCIMPSANLKKIVTASKDSTVKIFDRFTEENLYTSSKLDGAVYVACFNNDDRMVAASTSSGSIYFMDTTLTKIKMKIKGFNTRINTIHFSPCGKKILAGSEGGGAKIFSVITGELLHELDYSSLK